MTTGLVPLDSLDPSLSNEPTPVPKFESTEELRDKTLRAQLFQKLNSNFPPSGPFPELLVAIFGISVVELWGVGLGSQSIGRHLSYVIFELPAFWRQKFKFEFPVFFCGTLHGRYSGGSRSPRSI